MTDLGPIFDTIYREDRWAGDDSRSGPGSGVIATRRIATAIPFLIDLLGVRSVVDATCGDGRWFPDLPRDVTYTGCDVSREAVELARRNRPGRVFLINDLRTNCPQTDLVVLRDALQHLPLADGVVALAQVRESGSRWLLASTYIGGENVDVPAGGAYSPDLERAPFWMDPPALLIPDGFTYHDPHEIRDGRKMLGLWSLR